MTTTREQVEKELKELRADVTAFKEKQELLELDRKAELADSRAAQKSLSDKLAAATEKLEAYQGLESALRRILPAQTVAPATDDDRTQSLTLEELNTEIHVQPRWRELPPTDTDSTYGEIVELIADGKLDERRSEKQVKDMLPPDTTMVFKDLKKLVEQRILIRISDKVAKRTYYQKHPRVKAVKDAE
ncbi:MAG: hypothetical protein ACRD6W_03885 [Nitrososphaerales archaeon]